MAKELVKESAAAGTAAKTGDKVLITIATPGWGSSGYYSAAVLESAAKNRVFPAGTQMHMDHMGPGASSENPAGSVLTLAAKLVEDARWLPLEQKLVAEVAPGTRYRDIVLEYADTLGVSMAAFANMKPGQAEGRAGKIVEELIPHPLNRVDFVTVPGRGGAIEAILEHATLDSAQEAMASETRAALSRLVHDAYGGQPETFIYMLDYDDEYAVFEVDAPASSGTFRQTYSIQGNAYALTGAAQEVRRVVSYVPITATESAPNSPPVPAGVTEAAPPKEDIVAKIEIEETELTALRESASRVTELEAREQAREAAEHEANVTALVAEHFKGLEAPRTQQSIVAEALSQEMSTEAITALAKETAAELRVLRGAGDVNDLGDTAPVTESATTTEPKPTRTLEDAGRLLLEN